MSEGFFPMSTRRLVEVVTLNPRHEKGLPDDLMVSFIPMSGVDDRTGRIREYEERPLGDVKQGYTCLRDGDVIFAKITPCMENGKCAVVRGLKNGIGCGSTEFYVLRPSSELDPEYLHLFLRQDKYRQQARAAMAGAVGQARVPKQFILETKIPVPPIEEQRLIVARIEEIMQRTRRVRDSLERIPSSLDQLVASTLEATFSGELLREEAETCPSCESAKVLLEQVRHMRWRDWRKQAGKKSTLAYPEPKRPDLEGVPILPAGWCWASIDELAQWNRPLCYGIVQPGKEATNGPRLVRVCDLQEGSVVMGSLRSISREVHAQYGRSRVTGGEVLVSVVGTVGKVSVMPAVSEDVNIARAIARVAIHDEIPPAWIAAWLSTPFMHDRLTRGAREVARKTLNIDTLRREPVPIAPASTMNRSVEKINHILRLRRSAARRVAAAYDALNVLEQSALTHELLGQSSL